MIPSYFQSYVDLVKNDDLQTALNEGKTNLLEIFHYVDADKMNVSYQEGKWTFQQMLQHIIDAERVFVYRAMRFARNDSTDLLGFDENEFADVARAEHLSKAFLLEMYEQNRKTTSLFFESLNEEEMNRVGKASGTECGVSALGKIICGHELHHIKVIKERYFPVLSID